MKTDIKELMGIFKKIVYILTDRQKKKCCYIVVIIMIGSLLETIGVSMILPFVQALLSPQELLKNKLFAFGAQKFGVDSNIGIVFFAGVCLILVYFIKNLFLSYSSYKQIDFRWKMQKDLSTKMLASYMRRPYTYFLETNSSQILRGITDDISSLYTIIENLFLFMSNILTIILIGIYLCVSDLVLALTVLIVACTSFVCVTFGFRKLLNGVGHKQREANAEQRKIAYQAVNGIKEIDVMQRRDFFVDKYNEAYTRSMEANIKFNFLSACPIRIIETVCISGIIIVVCFKYGFGSVDVTFISKLAVFATAAFRILPIIGNLVGIANSLVYYRAGLEATYNNIKETAAYENKKNMYIQQGRQKISCFKMKGMQEVLSINNISWRYPNSNQDVLYNLSLKIYKNESVALIGSSGAGKTTLSDIILGLYQPQTGTVDVDGENIYAMPEEWSKIIGYVPQTVFLIDDTVRANVTLGIYEEDINDELVWKALERAQLADFIRTLPDGISTIVGEQGIKFSGGQRQRIAIARALYYDPEILVLDEATSALDNETEKAVMESIESLQGKKTLIIIAHRLSTIYNCNKIYEIKDRKAILKKKNEIFAEQFSTNFLE